MTCALVWTTGSRTSPAELACALVWFVLRPRLNVPGRLGLAAGFALGLPFLEERYAQVGQFADRVGTDALRARIDAASLAKLDHAPWHGQGLGEAWVMLADGKDLLLPQLLLGDARRGSGSTWRRCAS